MSDQHQFKYGEDYLTAGKALQIARGTRKGVLTEACVKKLARSQQIVEEIAAENEAVYGINTGFGP